MKEKILSIFILAFLLVIIGMTSVNAASCGVSVAGNDVEIGENVTVTVRFSEPATSASFRLNYDNTKLQYISNSVGGRNTGSSIAVDYLSLDLTPITSATFTFSTKVAGTANFSVSGITLSAANLEEYSISYNNGKIITIKEKTVEPPPVVNPPVDPEPVNPNPATPEIPEPENPTFRNDNSTVYATNNVNVRSSCLIDSRVNNILGMLKQGEEITRTGISNGWDRVTYKGQTAYIRHGYLSTEKPDDDGEDDNNPVDENNIVENNVIDEPIENNNVTENNNVGGIIENTNNTTDGDKYKNRKYIAIAISAGAIIAVGIIMFIIYKKVNNDDDNNDDDDNKNTTSVNNRTTARSTVARSTSTTKTTGTRNTTTRNSNTKTTTGKKQ